jgi:hypothetical protein
MGGHLMTDMESESHQIAAPPAGPVGRHRAAADPDHQPAENTRGNQTAGVAAGVTAAFEIQPVPPDMAVARALVAAKDPTRRSAVATLLPAGVGASAFHAAIGAARQSALRQELARQTGQSHTSQSHDADAETNDAETNDAETNDAETNDAPDADVDVEPNQEPGPSETPPDLEPGRRHWRRKRVNGHLTDVHTS